MKSQSLPKKLSITHGKIQPEIGQPGWSTFLKPIDQSMPQHSFPCQCQMCNIYQYKKFKQALQTQTKILNSKIKSRICQNHTSRKLNIQQNYLWIIKHLTIPTHKIATNSLNIKITQSLFYKDGQANQLYLNKQIEDGNIKKINKQKLTNAFIQKLMTQRRRKYKEYIRIKTGRKKIEQKKKLFFGQKQIKKQIKDAVLIRFFDGYQQLLTQNQFLNMFLKRKQDPLWKQIISIRNFINITNPQQQKSKYIVIKYRSQKIKYQQLFNRSKILIKIYGEYIIPENNEYINPYEQIQFCKQLQKQNLQIYAEYLTYQIVNFIEYFYDESINNLVIGIYFDEIGNSFLNQVYKLNKKSLIKFSWTDQIYRKRIDQQSTKVLQSKKINNQQNCQQGAQLIVNVMHIAYQKMRDQFGLTSHDEDDKQQVANNNFFRKMHPGFTENITDVLKNPNLGITEFKSKFLGIKSPKKPIIKEFTSNMIKTIHLTSPRLKNSQPHTYIESPKKNHSSIHYQSRKKDSILLSPLKIHSNIKFSTTLPIKQTI